MKLLNHIIRLGAVCGLILTVVTANAQTVQLKVMEWNVLSFEKVDGSGQGTRDITEYVALIKGQNPDIICINELSTGYSDMEYIDKLSEVAAALDMYPYLVMSYPKSGGYYGNGILSKYPIVNVASKLLSYKHAQGEGNYQWNSGTSLNTFGADQRSVGYADILVPTSDSDGQIVRIVCTHLDHMIESKGKVKQAQEVADFIGLANPVYPTILLGDLNTSSSGVPAINDVGDLVHSSFVDFIYTYPKGKWTRVSSQTVNAGNLSDHDAIVGTVTLN